MPGPDERRRKIVVVDDDPEMLELLSRLLAADYQVHTAADGESGLALVRRERPDLVVLDLLMPRMHGFEVCRRLREDPSLSGLKILVSSSKSYANDIATAKSAGADQYVVKPFEVDAFLAEVRELLQAPARRAKVAFWGTRGSIPTPGSKTVRYGGNTPCVELSAGQTTILVDAGTGLREWGNAALAGAAGKPLDAHLFIGHTHWDHIQGLPFCAPFYMPGNRFRVYGAPGTTQGLEQVLAGQMAPAYFPVPMKQMAARLEFVELRQTADAGGVKVSTHYLNHPGVTLGFRFEGPGWTVCYISDHEPYGKLNQKGEFSAKEDEAVARFVRGADVLISEAQYTDDEYKTKRSWGHSTFSDVAALAAKAQVKKLLLFHHDPAHTDEMMDRFLEGCRKELSAVSSRVECEAAMEGTAIVLGGPGPTNQL